MALVVVLVMCLMVLGVLGFLLGAALMRGSSQQDERARVQFEVRVAEHRLHQLASDAFQVLLDEARSHGK